MSALSASVPETSTSVEMTLPLMAPDGPILIDWAVTSPSHHAVDDDGVWNHDGTLYRHTRADIGNIGPTNRKPLIVICPTPREL